jgi:hypothetical protein
MFVHASMTLAPGNDQQVSDLLARSLPLLVKYGWTLAGSFRALSGPTRTLVNLWDIPDANAFTAFPAQIAADPDLLKIMIGLEEAMIHNELTLMKQVLPRSAAGAGAAASLEETLFVRETITALPGKSPSLDALIRQAALLLEERGVRFHGAWRRLTGATHRMMNLWELPVAASAFAVRGGFPEDPEIATALSAIADASREIESTPMKKLPFSP